MQDWRYKTLKPRYLIELQPPNRISWSYRVSMLNQVPITRELQRYTISKPFLDGLPCNLILYTFRPCLFQEKRKGKSVEAYQNTSPVRSISFPYNHPGNCGVFHDYRLPQCMERVHLQVSKSTVK